MLPILCLLIPVIGLSNVTGMQYLVTTKRERILTISVCIGAAVNFLCNLILIPKWSSVGAALASLVAEIVITGVQFVFIRKEISFGRVAVSSWRYLLSGGAMLTLLIIENQFFAPSILNTAIMVLSGGSLYILLLFLLRDEFFLGYVKKIMDKIVSR